MCTNRWAGLNRHWRRSKRWSSSVEAVFNHTITSCRTWFYQVRHDMFLGQHLWSWNNIVINQSDLKNKFIIFVKFRPTNQFCCLYISLIPLSFPLILGLLVGKVRFRCKWSRLNCWINMFPGSTIYVDTGTHLTHLNQDVHYVIKWPSSQAVVWLQYKLFSY